MQLLMMISVILISTRANLQVCPCGLESILGSFSTFYFLNIDKSGAKPWLSCPASFWPFVDKYKKLSEFVKNLEVVKDCAERGIKQVSQFVNSVHNEDDRQDLHRTNSTVQHRREKVRGAATKEQLQAVYLVLAERRKIK